MMRFKFAIQDIINAIKSSNLDLINIEQVENMASFLAKNKDRTIMVMGAGRTELIAKNFSMMLQLLGFEHVYSFGESTSSPLRADDVFFVVSGSGSTTIVVEMAEDAKRAKAKILAITANPESPLGKLADHIVELKGAHRYMPKLPISSLFHNAAWVFIDGLTAELMDLLDETLENMIERHPNIGFKIPFLLEKNYQKK
jgi:6-phospho-3-hexuloisomerase